MALILRANESTRDAVRLMEQVVVVDAQWTVCQDKATHHSWKLYLNPHAKRICPWGLYRFPAGGHQRPTLEHECPLFLGCNCLWLRSRRTLLQAMAVRISYEQHFAPEGHLDWIYLTVLNRSLDPDSDPDSIAPTPQEIRHCSNTVRDVLGSIVVLFSLLSVKSVCRLLLIPEGKEEEAKGTLRSLHAVLDIPEDETYVLRLHHPSFRDFLLNKRRCYDTYFWVDEKRTHQKLADRCIRLMSTSLKQNICEVNAPGIPATRIESRRVEQYLCPRLRIAGLPPGQPFWDQPVTFPSGPLTSKSRKSGTISS